MRKLILSILLASGGVIALAQSPKPQIRPKAEATTTTYEVLWAWPASPTSGGTPAAAGYNLYQAAAACPTSGIPAGGVQIATGDTLTTYTQSPAPSGVTCTWVTGVSAVGVEGLPSGTFQLNTSAPAAPGTPSATITAVAATPAVVRKIQ